MSPTYNTMLIFTADALIDVFAKQYVFEKSERKAQEVFQKIQTSKIINDYISFMYQMDRIPNPNELQKIMNSVTYFMFSKAETLCLGGLCTVLLWQGRCDPDEEKFTGDEIVKLCADFIVDISKTKVNVGDNFFRRSSAFF